MFSYYSNRSKKREIKEEMEDKEQNEEKAKKIKVLMVNAERNYSQFEGNDADPFEETTFEENENVI